MSMIASYAYLFFQGRNVMETSLSWFYYYGSVAVYFIIVSQMLRVLVICTIVFVNGTTLLSKLIKASFE